MHPDKYLKYCVSNMPTLGRKIKSEKGKPDKGENTKLCRTEISRSGELPPHGSSEEINNSKSRVGVKNNVTESISNNTRSMVHHTIGQSTGRIL